MCGRDKKRKTFAGNLFIYFKEYCDSTSIHGFRYLGEDRSIFEKAWWIMLFTGCLIGLTLSIMAVYSKWSSSPVIVSLANKETPIHGIPFPAITICSESKIRANTVDLSKLFDKVVAKKKLTRQEERYLNYLIPMCRLEDLVPYLEENPIGLRNDSEIYETIEELSPPFEVMNCKMWGTDGNCSENFTPIITDEGVCYSFNILERNELFTNGVLHRGNYNVMSDSSAWDPEHGYNEDAGIDTYPVRALLSGARYSIQFDLKIMKGDVDGFCRQSEEGFRILVHSPLRFPLVSQQFLIVPYDQRVSGAIRPSMITTSEAVRKYSPEKRRCYFLSEQKLKFFKTYSPKNCVLECVTEFTLAICGCVDFYMPRLNGTRICGADDYECLSHAEYRYQHSALQKEIKIGANDSEELMTEDVEMMSKCVCLPTCTDLEYQVELSQSPWNWYKDFKNPNDTLPFHLTRFSLYFISSNFIGFERNELYGPTDFLANFGGLLGLFTGFSVLSLLEIIYFLSVRMFCNMRLYGNWNGAR